MRYIVGNQSFLILNSLTLLQHESEEMKWIIVSLNGFGIQLGSKGILEI